MKDQQEEEEAEVMEHNKDEKPDDSYVIIKVARNEDLFEQVGNNLYFDLVDHDKVEVAKVFGVPVPCQRFWLWAKRQNNTYRPDRPLTYREQTQFVGDLCGTELNLFLEIELGLDLQAIPLPYMKKEDILLFFKLYDPEKKELRYVGKLSVKDSGKPLEILTKLNEMAGFAPNERIELYEEIKFEPTVLCERISEGLTFHDNELENGDIICFQKCPTVQSQARYHYLYVPSFLEHVRNRQCLASKKFREVEKQLGDDQRVPIKKLKTSQFQSVAVSKKVVSKATQRSQTCMPLVGMTTKENVMPSFFPPVEVMGAMPSSVSDANKGRTEETQPVEYPPFSKNNMPSDDLRKLYVDRTGIVYSQAASDRPTTQNNMPSGSNIPLQRNPVSGELSEASQKAGVECAAPMLDDDDEVIILPTPPSTQEGKIESLHKYPSAGQLFEEGKHCKGILDEKYEDIGGFSILRTQALLYKQVWLKYGHIATSQVLTASYSGQVGLVTDIMTSVMDMHNCRLSEVSSEMIDLWEKQIKMAEALAFNIGWLREHLEAVKKEFCAEQKHKTALLENDQSLQVTRDELKKAKEKVTALEGRIDALLLERQMHLEKGSSRLLFDGLL